MDCDAMARDHMVDLKLVWDSLHLFRPWTRGALDHDHQVHVLAGLMESDDDLSEAFRVP